MEIVATLRPRIKLNTVTHIKRSLLGSGKLTVVKNQEVAPHDILGKSVFSSGFSSVNLTKALKVDPSEGQKYLQRALGKVIYKGELLGFKKGLMSSRQVLAPTDGLIDRYDPKSGEVRLKFLPKENPLAAGVFGIVDQVDQTKGEVLIKTMVTEIYGLYGSGIERGGVIKVLGTRTGLIEVSQITQSLNQKIIITGALIYGKALRKSASFGVQGIVTGGLNLPDYLAMSGNFDLQQKLGSDVGISIMGTEGFGPLPMSEDIYNLIRSYDDQFAFMNGNLGRLLLPTADPDSILTLRKIALSPTALINSQPDLQLARINLRSKVRIIWPPFMGAQGTVVAIDKTATVLESGITTIMLTVETAAKKLKVPYPNVEIIA